MKVWDVQVGLPILGFMMCETCGGLLTCSPCLHLSLPAQKCVETFLFWLQPWLQSLAFRASYQCTPCAAAMPGQRERLHALIELHIPRERRNQNAAPQHKLASLDESTTK